MPWALCRFPRALPQQLLQGRCCVWGGCCCSKGALLPRGEGGSGVVGSAMMCSLLHCVKVKSI